MIFQQDEPLAVPVDLNKLVFQSWTGDIDLIDRNDKVYTKCLEGHCSVQFINGNSYEGDFHNGYLHGKGIFNWASGVKYSGDFLLNKMEGFGRFDWGSCNFYEGEISRGLRHGKGVMETNGNIYQGQWIQGQRQGHGKITYANKSTFEGFFLRGKKEGQGRMTYANGNWFSGNWLADKKDGFGEMHWLDPPQIYAGMWKDNAQQGLGSHMWLQKKDSKQLKSRFVGLWKKGIREGAGIFYNSNGSTYQGEWRKNVKEGKGILTDEKGQLFVVRFQNDRVIKSQGYIRQLKSDQQINPYLQLINLKDFIPVECYHPNRITKQSPFDSLLNVLLRNHSQLITSYKLFCSNYNPKEELGNILRMSSIWRILKDMRILGLKFTLIQLNRLYFQGVRNHFMITPQLQYLQQKLTYLQSRQSVDEFQLTEFAGLVNFLSCSGQKISSSPVFCKLDINSPQSPILFRNFVEVLVRASFIKYPGLEVHKNFEKFLGRVKLFQNQLALTKGENIQGELLHSDRLILMASSLFAKLTREQPAVNGRVMRTVRVGDLFALLEQASYLQDVCQRHCFFLIIQKQIDSQVSKQQTFRKDKKKQIVLQPDKTNKYLLLLEAELIEWQFETVLLQLFDKLSVRPEERSRTRTQDSIKKCQQKRFQKFVQKLVQQIPQKQNVPEIIFFSQKYHVRLQRLQTRRLVEEQKKHHQQLMEAQEQEQQARLFMAFEDHDVPSLQEDQEEDPDYF